MTRKKEWPASILYYSLFTFPFQGDKFYIELYGGNVVVTKRLDYESINNYTLKIVAKVGVKENALRESIVQ